MLYEVITLFRASAQTHTHDHLACSLWEYLHKQGFQFQVPIPNKHEQPQVLRKISLHTNQSVHARDGPRPLGALPRPQFRGLV